MDGLQPDVAVVISSMSPSGIVTALEAAGFAQAKWETRNRTFHGPKGGYTVGFRIKRAEQPTAFLLDHMANDFGYSLAAQKDRADWLDRYASALREAGYVVDSGPPDGLAPRLVIQAPLSPHQRNLQAMIGCAVDPSDPIWSLKAISIMQPWSYLIVSGAKDIENRDWPTRFRGRVLIHAGKKYDGERGETSCMGVRLPDHIDMGGIVGVAEIVDCVQESLSPWFFGKYGFVLRNAQMLPFRPCLGALGFFKPDFSRVSAPKQPKPAAALIRAPEPAVERQHEIKFIEGKQS